MTRDLRIVTVLAEVHEWSNGHLDVRPVYWQPRRADECSACTPAMRLVGFGLGGSVIDPLWLIDVKDATEPIPEEDDPGHGPLVELRVRLGRDTVLQMTDEALAAALGFGQVGCGLGGRQLPAADADGWVELVGSDAVRVEARQVTT